MPERTPQILGAIVIAAAAIGIVIAARDRVSGPSRESASPPEPDEPPEEEEHHEEAEGSPGPPFAEDLAARLLRAFDGGRPLSSAGLDPETGEPAAPPPLVLGSSGGAPPPNRPAPAAPPQPWVKLGRPVSLETQLEFAAMLHDWVLLRRDDQRRRLAELEESGRGSSAQATAIRRELARLDETEPRALEMYEELAQRARLAREAASRESDPASESEQEPESPESEQEPELPESDQELESPESDQEPESEAP